MGVLRNELEFFTGKNPRKSDLVLIHGVPLLTGFGIALAIPVIRTQTIWWQKLLIGEILPATIRHAAAGSLFVVGIIVYHYAIPVTIEWEWFGYVYLAKLLIAYPLDHHPGTPAR